MKNLCYPSFLWPPYLEEKETNLSMITIIPTDTKYNVHDTKDWAACSMNTY